jgi:hypothetical protein
MAYYSNLMYTLVYFKLNYKASFIPGLNFYCSPHLKSLFCFSHNAGRKMVWTTGHVNEYKTHSAIILLLAQ